MSEHLNSTFQMLRLSFACLLLFTISTIDASAKNYSFPNIGFQFDAPSDWHTISRESQLKLLQTQDYGTEELNELLRETKGQVLAIAKYQAKELIPFGVNPGLVNYLRKGEIQDRSSAAKRLETHFKNTVPRIKIHKTTIDTKLGSFDSLSMEYTYFAKTENKVERTIIEKTWIVPMGKFYLSVSTGFAPEQRSNMEPIINQSLNSFRPTE